ncbi:uncharacterized protein LOC100214478 [Hydra vulgaris]|uniref:ATP-dependent RNA helicase n=1 Tax=Hydra vulgaris TaxID=6087 RepID=A0ABM4DIU9_HYDVU
MSRYRAFITSSQSEIIRKSLSDVIKKPNVKMNSSKVAETSEDVIKKKLTKTDKTSKEAVKQMATKENASKYLSRNNKTHEESYKQSFSKTNKVLKEPLKTSISNNHKKKVLQNENEIQGEYFEEFMKLLKRQREPPFIYSSRNVRLENINLKILNPSLKYNQAQSFVPYGLNDLLIEQLKKNDINKPLEVQQRSLPELIAGRSAIIESSTGSGKTLAFLIPIVNDLGPSSCSNIILVPTRELASQIYKEIMKYIDNPHLVSRYVSGIDDEQERKLKNALRDCKVLISTPKRFLEIIEENSGHFRKVKRLVLDEVDKLLPFTSHYSKAQRKRVSKPKPAEKIINMITHYNKNVQLIATSATISQNLVHELQDLGFQKNCPVFKLYPDQYRYGRVPDNIKNLFTVVSGNNLESKLRWCIKLFEYQKLTSVLLFVSREESVEKTVELLKDMGYMASALYKELLVPSSQMVDRFLQDFKTGVIKFVVSNEETVRGMDFPFVDTVYMTYVPDSPEAYLHVAGRVGRLGRPGTALTFISEENEATELKHLKRRYLLLGIKGKRLELV